MIRYIVLLLFFLPFYGFAVVWNVGSARIYKKPSEVAPLVNHGDTIYIDGGNYLGDVCAWNKNDLKIIGINGKPHLQANGVSAMGKGIWVLTGNNITVKNVAFSGARVNDKNGAGIRLEGIGLNIESCYFNDNENGILTGYNGGKIVVLNSEFAANGDGVGYAHNIYIGGLDTAIIQFNYFHGAKVGHEFKSRARVNYLLYNRFSNELGGTASRNVDLPNGGVAILMGNIMEQSTASANNNMIGYGLEGLFNTAPHALYVINNTIVNNRGNGSFLDVQSPAFAFKVYNNIFAGAGTPINIRGSGATLDSSHNVVSTNIAQVGFVDAATYNYQITAVSPALNTGINAGTGVDGFSLIPVSMYQHPLQSSIRSIQGNIDIGAFEFYDNTLPVNFGTIAAYLKQDNLNVYWTTLQEKNNHFFEVQVSRDGQHFTTLDKVFSKAPDGNANEPINYIFTGKMDKVVWSVALLLLCCGVLVRSRKRLALWIAVGLMGVLLYSCSRSAGNIVDVKQRIFVRIAQIDKSGNAAYSKIIEVARPDQ